MESESFAPKDWFNVIFGFRETEESVSKNFEVVEKKDYVELKSKENGRTFNAGNFQIRTSERETYHLSESRGGGKLHIIHGHGKGTKNFKLIDVLSIQSIPEWDGATFLAASNFNCLEFVSCHQDARIGVTCYYADPTQGPYAAIACGPAAVYRNYFYKHDGVVGQISSEINLLNETPIPVEHGYAKIPNAESLQKPPEKRPNRFVSFFKNLFVKKTENDDQKPTENTFDWSDPKIWKVGVHRNCEVTMTRGPDRTFCVSPAGLISHHVYAAAFNFVSDVVKNELTIGISRELLKAEYRATVLAAWENSILFPDRRGSKKLNLTLLGGGVFANPYEIICEAILANVELIKESGLDVYITCFDDRTFDKIFEKIGPAVDETNGKIFDANDDEACKELIDSQ